MNSLSASLRGSGLPADFDNELDKNELKCLSRKVVGN